MRSARGLFTASAAIAATLAAAGCVSLLGDFSPGAGGPGDSGPDGSVGGADAGDGSKPGSDAPAGDAPSSDAPATGDGGTADGDAAAAPPLLTCGSFALANDVEIVGLVPGGGVASTFGGPLYVFHTASGVVQILADQNGGFGYTVYAFQATQGAPSVSSTPVDPPAPNDLLGAIPVSGGVLAWSLAGIGTGPGMSASATFIPAGFTGGTLASQELIPSSDLPAQEYTDLAIDVTEIASGDDFYLLSFGNAFNNPPTFTLFSGRTTNGDAGTPVVYSQGSTTAPGYFPALLNDGTTAYAFAGADPTVGSTTIQSFPLVPSATAGTPRSLGSPSLTGNVLVAAAARSAGSASVFDVASAVLDLSTTKGQWRVGQVPGAKLGTFTAADLAAAGSFASIDDLPLNGGTSQWAGDDALLIGKGPATSTPGFNFYWFDAQGNRRVAAGAAASGAAYGILADRTGTQQAAIAVNQIVGTGLAKFDVVWTEQYPDGDGGVYQVLKYNVLVCTP